MLVLPTIYFYSGGITEASLQTNLVGGNKQQILSLPRERLLESISCVVASYAIFFMHINHHLTLALRSDIAAYPHRPYMLVQAQYRYVLRSPYHYVPPRNNFSNTRG